MSVLTSVLAPPAPNPVDLLFHAAGQNASHPEAEPRVGAVLHLTGSPPDLAQLRGRVSRRLDRLPCLSHVLRADDGPPRWVSVRPDLEQHVGAHRSRAGADGVDDAVRELLRQPLPVGAPAWRLVVLAGHAAHEYCLVYLTHHSVQDAGNIVSVLETLFGPDEGSGPTSSTVPRFEDTGLPGPRQVLGTVAHTWRGTRPHGLWTSSAQPLSGCRHTLWQDMPNRLLRETARAYGATRNDVHLAALTHAISQWAAEHRPEACRDPLPMMVPVNLRTHDETALPGNRFFLARLDLPGGSMPAPVRLRRTLAPTGPLKDPAYRQSLYRLTRHTPRTLLDQVIARSAQPDSLTAVGSIFTVRKPLRYHGDPVHRFAPIICCPNGFPLAVGLFLYGETSTASFQIDSALTGAEAIPRLWRQAVDDMAAGVGAAVSGE